MSISQGLSNRVVNKWLPPIGSPLLSEHCQPDEPPNCIAMRNHLLREGRLTKRQCLNVIARATGLFRAEPNRLRLTTPIVVIGDTHGQFYDLLRILDLSGNQQDTKYLFLGDYVDRGYFSIEIVLYLFALKINRPEDILLLRGNHESRQMTSYFNFKDECIFKYDLEVYDAFMEAFDCLPIAASIDDKFLCIHGGLSPGIVTLADLDSINRFSEPPQHGAFCDILWSDPAENPSTLSETLVRFAHNSTRGCSYIFYPEATHHFLRRNKLIAIVRGHEAQLHGYNFHHKHRSTGFPAVITIFSAANYCDVYNNKGAFARFHPKALEICQFDCAPHPFALPNFMDIFSWSIPFIFEKLAEILYSLLDTAAEISDAEHREALALANSKGNQKIIKDDKIRKRREVIAKKVAAVARLIRLVKIVRNERMIISELRGLNGGHRVPLQHLLQGRYGLQSEIERFYLAKHADRFNETRPRHL